MDPEHIRALSNLSSNTFSRDCYFYYIVPDEEISAIAQHFNDPNWIEYSKLKASDRLAYRKANCRTGSSSGHTSDDDDNSSTVSAMEESTEEQAVPPIASPFYSLTEPRSRVNPFRDSPEFNLLMHVLAAMLFFKLLNDIMNLKE